MNRGEAELSADIKIIKIRALPEELQELQELQDVLKFYRTLQLYILPKLILEN